MASKVSLTDLVGAVMHAIASAQGEIERHYLDTIGNYFDSQGRPKSFDIKIPSGDDGTQSYSQLAVPLLSLIEARPLAIRDMEMDLQVEIDSVAAPDLPAPPSPAPNSSDDGGKAAAAAAPSSVKRRDGAPIDVPAMGLASAHSAPMRAKDATIATALAQPDDIPQSLTIGIGGAQDTGGPTAKLKIKLEARDPTEGVTRLVTQLNKGF